MSRSTAEALVRGVIATTTVAAAALSHVGWWLDWHTRARAGQGCRTIEKLD